MGSSSLVLLSQQLRETLLVIRVLPFLCNENSLIFFPLFLLRKANTPQLQAQHLALLGCLNNMSRVEDGVHRGFSPSWV